MEVKTDATESVEKTDSEKNKLWVETIQREARMVLGKFLPDALPQEPTEVMVGLTPFLIGKFRGKHYISLEHNTRNTEFLEGVLRDGQKEFKDLNAHLEEESRQFSEFLLNLQKRFQTGEDIPEEEQHFVYQPKETPQVEEVQELDWAERLEKGKDYYTIPIWRDIHALTHEMIHQRQAELNPQAFPELSSSGIDNIDPDKTDRNTLRELLTEAHRKNTRERKEVGADSIFYPVIEGMAVLGSYYAMAQLENDLRANKGNVKTADTVREARKDAIYHDLETRRQVRRGEKVREYQMYYIEGTEMMRKIYKKFGIEGAIQALKTVDLAACQSITRGTPEYQAITEDPTTLPGLNIK